MGKNIVFFADGTGNDRAEGVKTNVARLSDCAENMRVRQDTLLPTRRHFDVTSAFSLR